MHVAGCLRRLVSVIFPRSGIFRQVAVIVRARVREDAAPAANFNVCEGSEKFVYDGLYVINFAVVRVIRLRIFACFRAAVRWIVLQIRADQVFFPRDFGLGAFYIFVARIRRDA